MPQKTDKDIVAEAKELVNSLEQQGLGQTAINHELSKMNMQAGKMTDVGQYEELRKIELARAYVGVSDGKGGVSREAHTVSRNAWESVLSGKAPNGQGLSDSHRFAASINRPDLMLEEHGKRFAATSHVASSHAAAEARPSGAFNSGSRPAERVSVSTSHGPARGFASVKMMALTAAVTAIAVPALRHLLPERVTEPPQIRTSALERALSEIEHGAPATPASAPLVQRDKPGGP